MIVQPPGHLKGWVRRRRETRGRGEPEREEEMLCLLRSGGVRWWGSLVGATPGFSVLWRQLRRVN